MNIDPDLVSQHALAIGDRRRSPRVEVHVNMVGQVASSRVQLANISDGGCLVYASCLLRVGDTHALRFWLAPDAQEVRVDARVVHVVGVNGDPETVCVAGVEFVGDSEQQRAAIERLQRIASTL